MRTSRISKETAKVIATLSPSPRQTRSSAASNRAFIATSSIEPLNSSKPITDENEDSDDSSLSSAPSVASFDIEDYLGPSKKRKHGLDSPVTTVTTSTTISARTSPRKRGIKPEDGDEAKAKKPRRQPARKVTNEAGDIQIQPPSNWEEMYDCVREMRKIHLAPVDTMGCERIAEEHRDPKDKRFQTLIALMLSSQTKDTTNALTMRRLQTELPAPGLTLANIRAVAPDTLNALIYAVGFHNNKTRYIKAAAEILHERFDDDIPDTVEDLMSLPGVGPKMAYLCMSAAWGRTEGIGVDVHVHRITNLWGWHGRRPTRNPEETRASLEAWLPRERWHEINHLLVGFGQTICLPIGRRCGECGLAERGLCKSAVRGVKVKARRKERSWLKRRKGARYWLRKKKGRS